jgi:hypothetical protein
MVEIGFSCFLLSQAYFFSTCQSWKGKGECNMSETEKQMLNNQGKFIDEMLLYMKQHDQRLQRIEQYNLQLVAVFNQASEGLEDV